jgi:lipopolysaccharide/colanic/teichoic acid biosynthesis glycosyltransferase
MPAGQTGLTRGRHAWPAIWYNALMLPWLFPPGVPVAKRIFDLLLTLPGLALVSPLIGATALALWLSEGRPVMFRQPRAGLHGRVFFIYKFRTMREAADEQGRPLPDEQRISKLGKFLRAASLDELPELANVLRGEMSLVGPRPLMAKYLGRYNPEQMRRHETLPGITGWAQTHGRNALTWEERFALDVWYVDHWSFWLDVKILALTLWKVFKREGISEPGKATMTEFMGGKGDR